jgi:hypothetical protein
MTEQFTGLQSVTFTGAQVIAAIHLADMRATVKRLFQVKTKRVDQNQTELDLHITGVLSEWAAARVLGVAFDPSVKISSDDKVKDLVFKGLKIQVKSTPYKPSHLRFNSVEEFQADYAVLVRLKSWTQYEVLGYISREDFIRKHKTTDYGYGTRYYVPSEELKPTHLLNQEA